LLYSALDLVHDAALFYCLFYLVKIIYKLVLVFWKLVGAFSLDLLLVISIALVLAQKLLHGPLKLILILYRHLAHVVYWILELVNLRLRYLDVVY